MHPIAYIRRAVFGITQREFATEVLGVTNMTISNWERGESEPTRAHMILIRNGALARGLPWNDRWFFEPPALDGMIMPGQPAESGAASA